VQLQHNVPQPRPAQIGVSECTLLKWHVGLITGYMHSISHCYAGCGIRHYTNKHNKYLLHCAGYSL